MGERTADNHSEVPDVIPHEWWWDCLAENTLPFAPGPAIWSLASNYNGESQGELKMCKPRTTRTTAKGRRPKSWERVASRK